MTRQQIFEKIQEILPKIKKENSHFNRNDKVIEDLIKDMRSLCNKWPILYVPGFTAISYKIQDTLDLLQVIDNDLIMGFKPEFGKSNEWTKIACEVLGLWHDQLYSNESIEMKMFKRFKVQIAGREVYEPNILDKIKSDYRAYRKRRDPQYSHLRLPKKPISLSNKELTESLIAAQAKIKFLQDKVETSDSRSIMNNVEISARLRNLEDYINLKYPEAKLWKDEYNDDE